MTLSINAPSFGDLLASPPRHFDFSVGGGAGGHVNHDGRFFLAREGDGNGVGAKHALGTPQGRDQLGRICHRPTDQVALQSFKHIVAGDSVVVGIPHADPARAGLLRHVHGHAIRLRAHNQSQAIVAIHGCGTQCRAHDFDLRPGIDAAQSQHFEVGAQTGDAVGINAAQVRASKHLGSLHGIGLGNSEVQEHTGAEFTQGFDREAFCLNVGHVHPRPSRNLRRQGPPGHRLG